MRQPQNIVLEKLKLISKKYYITFFSTIVFGLCAHLYQFTNKLYNYDELAQTPAGYGCGIPLGRWGLQLLGDSIGAIFGNYSFPMINGLITLFFIAVSACLIVAALAIEDKVLCALIGGICVTFPVVTSTYFFMFTAPYYGFALLLGCLSSYFVIHYYKNWLLLVLSMFLLAFSTGIYQAYFPVAICICLIHIMVMCLKNENRWLQVLRQGIYVCVFLAGGMLSYLLINKAVIFLSGAELDTYRNVENMADIHIGAVYYSIKRCYSAFFALMTEKDILQLNPTYAVKISFGILFISCFILLIINVGDKNKELMLRICSFILLGIFPVSIFFIFIMTQSTDGSIYTLMSYPCVFIFVLAIALCDKAILIQLKNKCIHIAQTIAAWAIIVSVLVCIFVYIWFSNGNYQALQYTMYHDMAYGSTIMTQIKNLEGYNEEMPVAIVGEYFQDSTNAAGDLMGDNRFNIGGKYSTNINDIERIHIFTKYLGFTPTFLEEKDVKEIAVLNEVKEMPCYPDDGSIEIINGTIVVKISEFDKLDI